MVIAYNPASPHTSLRPQKHGLNATLSVFETVSALRQRRPAMVQSKEQYVFIYKAIMIEVKRVMAGNHLAARSPATQMPEVGQYITLSLKGHRADRHNRAQVEVTETASVTDSEEGEEDESTAPVEKPLLFIKTHTSAYPTARVLTEIKSNKRLSITPV